MARHDKMSDREIEAEAQLQYVRLLSEIETRLRSACSDQFRTLERQVRASEAAVNEQISYALGVLRDSGPAARAQYAKMIQEGNVLTINGWLLAGDDRSGGLAALPRPNSR